jgi:uncharacterized protein (TIGR03437 family)
MVTIAGRCHICCALVLLTVVCVAMSRAADAVVDVSFDSAIHSSGHGDNWHMTWAADDYQYTALGDGKGWENGTEYNTRVYRLIDGPANLRPQLLSEYPVVLSSLQQWYGYGILAIDNRLYHFIGHIDTQSFPRRFVGAKLVYSPDHGESWKNADGTPMSFEQPSEATMFSWNTPDNTFSLVSVLQAGKNYSDNTDGYVYIYAPNGATDDKMRQLVMARVPKDKVLSKSAYEYFVSRKADGSATWSRRIEDRGVVHQYPAGWVASDAPYSWNPSIAYNKPLNIYLMAAAGTARNRGRLFNSPSYLGIYTAPQPWGPWTQIHENTAWISGGDASTRLYQPVIAPKWIAEDGKSFYLVFSDAKGWGIGNPWVLPNYRFNVQKVTLQTEPVVLRQVVNAASFAAGPISPGELIALFGSGLGPKTGEASQIDSEQTVFQSLAGTRVLIDGKPAPVLFARSDQIVASVPHTLPALGTASLHIERSGGASDPIQLSVSQAAPAIFTLDSSGKGQAVVLNEDGGLNSSARPAKKGSVVVFYITGGGLTETAAVDGRLADGVNRIILPVTTRVGGMDAQTLYAGHAPGIISGVLQVNAVVPADVPESGAVPIVVSVGEAHSEPGVTVYIE